MSAVNRHEPISISGIVGPHDPYIPPAPNKGKRRLH